MNYFKKCVLSVLALTILLSLFLSAVFLIFNNDKSFSQTLSDLGAFGSYMSGIGTLIASVAAVIGVENWVRQLKYGKYIDVIWSAKVNLRKVFNAEMDWYIYKYQSRQVDTLTETVEQKRLKLLSCFDELALSFDMIDQIVERDRFMWSNRESKLRGMWISIDNHMVTHSHQDDFMSMELPNLNSNFDAGYNNLLCELELLEEKISKSNT
ncbi:hypothetical protein C9E85_15895 [Plesiomonas shigelloides]|uniref:hypothetical protein n=1 Tax=Plesiomonas shigelloides TaxID=703 RepID=UPI000D583807|nr:hypothetical protein [Plesiomonas shigelloides]PVU64876.1 hypothetical protein C9E85_15895 [Plesiomonas shigelloides]